MTIDEIMAICDRWAADQGQPHGWAPRTNEETKGQQAICQIREEIKIFLTEIEKLGLFNGKACEIGMGLGGSHFVFRQCFSLVVTVEPNQEVVKDFQNRNIIINEGVFVVGMSNYENVLNKVGYYGPYEMVFVDGEHSYEGVKEDYIKYLPFLKSGGVIAFHDSKGDERVTKFTNDLEEGLIDGSKHEIRRIELGSVAGITYTVKA